MGVEILKVLLTTAGALCVGWFLHALKEGGRRGRQRREIIEELELAEKLRSRPTSAAILEVRIDMLLIEYLAIPGPPRHRRLVLWLVRGALTLAGAAAVVYLVGVSWWGVAITAVVVGATGAIAEAVLETKWETSDRAKAEIEAQARAGR